MTARTLIERAVDTLKRALIEEILIVTLVHIVFLLHLRSVLIVTLPLPLAVLAAFLFMRYLGISSNIMSLAGIAIAIGVLVDAAIVVTENAFRFIEQRGVDPRDRRRVWPRPCSTRRAWSAGRSSSRWRSSFSPSSRSLRSPARRASSSIRSPSPRPSR